MAIIVQTFNSDGEGEKMLADTYLGFSSDQLRVTSVDMADGGVDGELSDGSRVLFFETYSATPNYHTRTLIQDPHGTVHECANPFSAVIAALNESQATGYMIKVELS